VPRRILPSFARTNVTILLPCECGNLVMLPYVRRQAEYDPVQLLIFIQKIYNKTMNRIRLRAESRWGT
jgi:hypothetical protein